MRIIASILSIFMICYVCFSCTVSFQNISTNGKASDVVDEEQAASPTVSPNIDMPLPVLG